MVSCFCFQWTDTVCGFALMTFPLLGNRGNLKNAILALSVGQICTTTDAGATPLQAIFFGGPAPHPIANKKTNGPWELVWPIKHSYDIFKDFLPSPFSSWFSHLPNFLHFFVPPPYNFFGRFFKPFLIPLSNVLRSFYIKGVGLISFDELA